MGLIHKKTSILKFERLKPSWLKINGDRNNPKVNWDNFRVIHWNLLTNSKFYNNIYTIYDVTLFVIKSKT